MIRITLFLLCLLVAHWQYASAQDFHVETANQLVVALSAADSGHVIYIPSGVSMDMSSYADLQIPGHVTLRSDTEAHLDKPVLSYNTTFPDGTYRGLFITGGEGVVIDGLKLIGPWCGVEENPFECDGDRVVSNAIRAKHEGLTVINSDLGCWMKWAIDLEVNGRHYIAWNNFHHNRQAGYGYGIWVRGSADGSLPTFENTTLIEHNTFYKHRNAIDRGSQQGTSVIIRYNYFNDLTQAAVDTHPGVNSDSYIIGNVFSDMQTFATRLNGQPLGVWQFTGNILARGDLSQSVYFSPSVDTSAANIIIEGNIWH